MIENAAPEVSQYFRGLSQVQLRRLFQHQRWLNSDGKVGERLILSQKWSVSTKDLIDRHLDGIDLSKAILSGISFKSSSLKFARFTGAELRNVSFYKCNLEGADFRGAQLENVSFADANTKDTRFDQEASEPAQRTAGTPTQLPSLML